jgi:hypothetical protein
MEERNLLIVSDLHLCEGLDPQSGKFSRLEDFLFDDAFARFLHYHEEVKNQPRFGGRPWLLILNGDLLDFLQVVSLPEEGRMLHAVKGIGRHKELRINERDYGLGTTAEESEWKLKRIARGHQSFFAALGWFVAHSNHIAVLKGNHDIEFHWPSVWERFVVEVERAYTRERLMLGQGPSVTSEELDARIRFCPWFYYEPGRVYVEHGGQYEPASYFADYLNPVVPDDPERIQLPWGSLFVRYLFNKVEDVHPFADNVKPPVRYLMWAFRKGPDRDDQAARDPWLGLPASLLECGAQDGGSRAQEIAGTGSVWAAWLCSFAAGCDTEYREPGTTTGCCFLEAVGWLSGAECAFFADGRAGCPGGAEYCRQAVVGGGGVPGSGGVCFPLAPCLESPL